MCPVCRIKLLPIVYGKLNPDLVDMEKAGKLVIGGTKYAKGKPRSICPFCEEAYDQAVSID